MAGKGEKNNTITPMNATSKSEALLQPAESSATTGNISKSDNMSGSFEDMLQTFSTSLCKEGSVFKEEDYLVWDMNAARKSGAFCDVTLFIGPDRQPMRAHRLILSLVSEYFKTMFESEFKEQLKHEVEISHMDIETMETIIEFAYTGEVEFTNGNIEKITRGANYFGMPVLLGNCTLYIRERLDDKNCIEVLQFAEHISNVELKDSAKRYLNEHFDTICLKNLDLMKMSTPLLLEIIGDDRTSIDGDPQENEERLFQLGWTHLFSKSDGEWKAFLPDLLKAVHLPLTSEQFLCNLSTKVQYHEEARLLVEKAKVLKSTIQENHGELASEYTCDENKKWCADRSVSNGSIKVVCKNFGSLKDSEFKFESEPKVLKGKIFKLTVQKSSSYSEIRATLQCLSNFETEPVSCLVQIEIPPPGDNPDQVSYISKGSIHTFKNEWPHRVLQFTMMKPETAYKKYYYKKTDSITVSAYIDRR